VLDGTACYVITNGGQAADLCPSLLIDTSTVPSHEYLMEVAERLPPSAAMMTNWHTRKCSRAVCQRDQPSFGIACERSCKLSDPSIYKEERDAEDQPMPFRVQMQSTSRMVVTLQIRQAG
jgi:hypothetical protein